MVTTVHLDGELKRIFDSRVARLGLRQKTAYDEALRLWLEGHGEPVPAPPPPPPSEEDRYVQFAEQLIRNPKGLLQVNAKKYILFLLDMEIERTKS